MALKDLLLEIDFLSYSPQILFKGKERVSNWLGTLVSLVLSIATFVLGLFFLFDSTERKKYFLQSSDIFTGTDNFTLESFDFVVDLRNGWFESFPEFSRYFNVRALFQTEKLDLERCSIRDKFGNITIPLGSDIDSPMFCLPKNFDYPLHTYGGGKYLTILFSTCANQTLPDGSIQQPSCYPYETIKEKLTEKEAFAFVFMRDRSVNHSSVDNVFPDFMNTQFLRFSLDLFFRYQLKFQPIIYNIDQGYIFESIQTKKGYIYNGKDLQVDVINEPEFKFGHLDILLDPYKKVYLKTFVKLQTVAANVGGVAKFMLIVGQIIVYIYSKNLFYFKLHYSLSDKMVTDDLNKNTDSTKNEYQEIKNIANKNLDHIRKKEFNEPCKTLKTLTSEIKPDILYLSLADLNSDDSIRSLTIIKNLNDKRLNSLNGRVSGHEKPPFFQMFYCFEKNYKKVSRNVLSYEKALNSIFELENFKHYMHKKEGLLYFGDGFQKENNQQYNVLRKLSPNIEEGNSSQVALQNFIHNKK